MKKIHLGILFGTIAGIIDVIPMIIQKLTWDADLSAFFHWIIVGFFIAATNLQIKGAWKGLLISFLLLIPTAILISRQEPFSLIPMSVMTVILGLALGYTIDKYSQ